MQRNSAVVLSRIFLPIFIVFSVMVPRESYALLPALAFIELAQGALDSFVIREVALVTTDAIGTAANDATWLSTFTNWMTGARRIGSVVSAVNNLQGSSAAINHVEIQTSLLAGNDLTRGTLAPGYHVTALVFPSSSIDGLSHTPPSTVKGSTMQTAFNAWMTWANQYFTASNQVLNIASTGCTDNSTSWACDYCTPVNCFSSAGGSTSDGGYPSVESSDGIGRIVRSGSVWSADSTDPDWSSAQITAYKNMSAVRVNGLGLTGNASHLDVVPLTSGAIEITYQEQVDAQHVLQKDVLTNTDIVPVGYDVATLQGSLSAAPETTTTTTNISLNLPTDYARQGEAAAAANSLAPKLDQLHADLNPANVPASMPVEATAMQDAATQLDAVASGITAGASSDTGVSPVSPVSIFQPFQPAACVPLTSNISAGAGSMLVGNHALSLDLCPYVPTIQNIFGWVLYVLTAYSLFVMFTGRPEQEPT